MLKQTLLYFKNLINNSKDSFILLGIIVYPIFTIIRALFFNTDPSVKSLISFFFGFLNLLIFFLAFFNQNLKSKLIKVLSLILNSRISQYLLFFFLWMEQFVLIHPLMFVIVFGVFSFLYFEAIFFSLYWGFFFQLILTCGLIYFRLRKSFLNEKAFNTVGLNYTRPYNWATVINGLNQVLMQKLTYTNFQSSKSQTSTGFGIYPALRSSKNVSVSTTTTGPIGVSPNGPYPALIFNQKTILNEVVFPFLPISHRRSLTTRGAFKHFASRLWDSFERAPLETTSAVGAGVSAVVAATIVQLKDQRDFEFRKQQDQRDFEFRKLSQEQNIALQEKQIHLQEHQINMQEKQINMQEHQINMQEKQINMQENYLQESRELRLLQERTQNLVMEGKLPPESVKQWLTLNPADGNIIIKNQNPGPGSLEKVSLVSSQMNSSETERLINLSDWFV